MIGFKDNNEVERIMLRKWAVQTAVGPQMTADQVVAAAKVLEAYVLSDVEKPAPTQLVLPITVTVNPVTPQPDVPADPAAPPAVADANVVIADAPVTPTTIAATP